MPSVFPVLMDFVYRRQAPRRLAGQSIEPDSGRFTAPSNNHLTIWMVCSEQSGQHFAEKRAGHSDPPGFQRVTAAVSAVVAPFAGTLVVSSGESPLVRCAVGVVPLPKAM